MQTCNKKSPAFTGWGCLSCFCSSLFVSGGLPAAPLFFLAFRRTGNGGKGAVKGLSADNTDAQAVHHLFLIGRQNIPVLGIIGPFPRAGFAGDLCLGTFRAIFLQAAFYGIRFSACGTKVCAAQLSPCLALFMCRIAFADDLRAANLTIFCAWRSDKGTAAHGADALPVHRIHTGLLGASRAQVAFRLISIIYGSALFANMLSHGITWADVGQPARYPR